MSELVCLRDAIIWGNFDILVSLITDNPKLLHAQINKKNILVYAIRAWVPDYDIIKYLADTGVFNIPDIISKHCVVGYDVSVLTEIRSILEKSIKYEAKSAHKRK
jgi:hypothetical protein